MRVALVGFEWDVVDLVESLNDIELVGAFDPKVKIPTPCLGNDQEAIAILKDDKTLYVALTHDAPSLRKKLFHHYPRNRLVSVVSPYAHVSLHAEIGDGCIVQRNVTIMPKASIANACKINVGATLHHESRVGAYSTIAPGARLLGRVIVGESAFIGAEATINPGCKIGDGAIVGAGAVVVSDVAPGTTAVGVPAHPT